MSKAWPVWKVGLYDISTGSEIEFHIIGSTFGHIYRLIINVFSEGFLLYGIWKVQMLTEDEIREKVIEYCLEQNGVDSETALKIEQRVLGLCESLGVDVSSGCLSGNLLERAGIKVLGVNPEWILKTEEIE